MATRVKALFLYFSLLILVTLNIYDRLDFQQQGIILKDTLMSPLPEKSPRLLAKSRMAFEHRGPPLVTSTRKSQIGCSGLVVLNLDCMLETDG